MSLKEKIKKFPDSPGVYLMQDSQGKIIYIGKALSLKKRVSSYFFSSLVSSKQSVLVKQIADIDIVLTPSEAEALILEAGLIKEHKPKYNIAIKDDKAYPFLKLTIKLAQGLLNTRTSLFIAERDSKRILKGRWVLKDRPIKNQWP